MIGRCKVTNKNEIKGKNSKTFLYLCRRKSIIATIMSKHKSGKRLNKKMLVEMLQTLFQQNPNETFSLKDVFKNLKLSTHPAKMLAVETMDEMAWDDFLTKTSAKDRKSVV